MIALHRPFDLGDRVYLAPSGSIETGSGNFGASWFVEEINLGVTKLRYAKTGETGKTKCSRAVTGNGPCCLVLIRFAS
jgi:hypothetical protein